MSNFRLLHFKEIGIFLRKLGHPSGADTLTKESIVESLRKSLKNAQNLITMALSLALAKGLFFAFKFLLGSRKPANVFGSVR